jgi:hypothetical protein
MKNYLFYPDCFTEESINHCRFALLKYLGLYNLQPPANISVIVHTNKAAAFEIFQPFFAEMMLKDNQPKAGWSDLASLQQLTSGYQGNHLVCRPLGHPREKLDDLYLRISQGHLLYSLPQTTDVLPPTSAQLSEKAIVIGINTQTIKQSAQGHEGELQNISTHFTTYSNRKDITNLLRLFFLKNEEESTANLVKKAKGLDLEALEKERITTKNLPFFKRMVQKFRKKNSLLQHYRNKL